jgi:hypothetical protein
MARALFNGRAIRAPRPQPATTVDSAPDRGEGGRSFRPENRMKIDMRPRSGTAALLAAMTALLAVVAFPVAAALGGDEATVEADRVQMKSSVRIARVQRFAVHEMAAESGTVVREYVSPAGKVFGVAWNGPTMPDLRQVLGVHFDTYVDAAAKRARRGPVQIAVPGLIVQSSGHMRAFVGSAYLPDELPQGVAAEEIR